MVGWYSRFKALAVGIEEGKAGIDRLMPCLHETRLREVNVILQ